MRFRVVVRALVTALLLSTAAVGLTAAPASAGVCSPYLKALTPLIKTYTDGNLWVWGQVKVASDGYPCLGHHRITVYIQRSQNGGATWQTYGGAIYLNLPASELGAVLRSLPIKRGSACSTLFRTRYTLDQGLTVTGTARRAC